MSSVHRLTNIVLDKDYCAGIVGNLVVVNWRVRTTKPAVIRLSELVSEAAGKSDVIGLLGITEEGASLPDTEARDALAETTEKYRKQVRASGLIIEGTGMRAAATRSILSAIGLLTTSSVIPQAFSEIEKAATYMQPLLATPGGPNLTVAEIRDAYREVRSHGRP